MSSEVYLINFCLALLIYFLLNWRLRKIDSGRTRVIISLSGAIILAPLIYIGAMTLFYFSIYERADKNIEEVNSSGITSDLFPSQPIDTAKVILEADSLRKENFIEKSLPYILTIDHSGFEDAYEQYWHFTNDFELVRIDYNWAGEGFSGNGVYQFSKNRLCSKVDTSRDEGYKTTHTFYYYQLKNSGGIINENLIQDDSLNNQKIKETKIRILSKVDFATEERKIFKEISDHLTFIKKLKRDYRLIDKKIELKQIDTVKYPGYGFAEILTYKLDSLLFKELIK